MLTAHERAPHYSDYAGRPFCGSALLRSSDGASPLERPAIYRKRSGATRISLPPPMNPGFRHLFYIGMMSIGIALMPIGARGEMQDRASEELSSTPKSVEDLQQIEHQLQQILPKILPAIVCIEVNNGSGSGILVSEDGLLFSAAHVVGNKGTALQIILSDGTQLPGKTTEENSETDAGIAMITKPLTKKLPCVKKTAQLPHLGDWVFALGHGGGWDRERGPMVRLGRVVSLKNEVIQTDCKLIRGDSGGPLFNMNGELIGIHSRIGSGLEDNLHVPMKDFNTLGNPTPKNKFPQQQDTKASK